MRRDAQAILAVLSSDKTICNVIQKEKQRKAAVRGRVQAVSFSVIFRKEEELIPNLILNKLAAQDGGKE